MIDQTLQPSLESQQEMLDRLFAMTPETRRRLDEGDVPERELRRVYTLAFKRDPWSFRQRWMDSRWHSPPVGLMLVSLVLGLVIFLVVLGFGNRLSAQHSPMAGPWLVLGICGATLYMYHALSGGIQQLTQQARARRATRPGSRPALQIIDAEVYSFHSWDTTTGSEFDMILPTSELVLDSIERAVPGDSQNVRDGKVPLPMKMAAVSISGPVRIYLISGAHQSSPLRGSIVGITLRQGASVIEREPSDQPQRGNIDRNHKICAD